MIRHLERLMLGELFEGAAVLFLGAMALRAVFGKQESKIANPNSQ